MLAKAASGALEYVPIVTVQNLARAMAELKERGYLLVGLDSSSETDLGDVPLRAPLALVLGAEGRGLRQLTHEQLRRCRPARAAGPDQVAQRVECRRARALCHDQAAWLRAYCSAFMIPLHPHAEEPAVRRASRSARVATDDMALGPRGSRRAALPRSSP